MAKQERSTHIWKWKKSKKGKNKKEREHAIEKRKLN